MSTTFDHNLALLAQRAPATAAAVGAAEAGAVRIAQSPAGEPVIELNGRALDSRRDPRAAAQRAAARVDAGRVVVVGFGSGYFVEALLARGVEVTAVVESSAAVLAAALAARDLSAVLTSVPIILTEALRDSIQLARLRAGAPTIVPHGPSVTSEGDLAALVARWDQIRVSVRRPRLLVVGPIVGGSLEIARAVARAGTALGCDTRLFDASVYREAHAALDHVPAGVTARRTLQSELASLIGRAAVTSVDRWRPDLVFALAQAPLDHRALEAFRRAGAATAFWFVENRRVLTYWHHVAPHYDYFYAIQPGRFLGELRDAGAAHAAYLPVACDPTVHRPVELTPEELSRYGADVSFAGSAYLNRRRVFAQLTDLPLRLWGAGWMDRLFAPLAADGGRSFDLDEMLRVFAGTRINLNLHSANHVDGCDPEPDYVNPRTFELAASGAFQLVDARDPLPALFTAEEAVTFRTVPQLRSLIAHYLAHDDDRHAVIARARARAVADHTYEHRLRQVMADTLAPELVAAAESAPARPQPLSEAIADHEQASPTLTPDEAVMRAVREIETGWERR